MKLRMILPFISILTLVLAAACWYMARRSMALCPALHRHSAWVWGFFAGFLILQFGIPMLHRMAILSHLLDPLYWVSYGLLGFVSTYFVYLAFADLVQMILRRGFQAPPSVGFWAFLIAISAASASVLIGLITVLRPVALRQIEVPIRNLPSGMDGFRIIQISDLHLGPLARRSQVQHIVDLTRNAQPDLIAITGDLVDGEADGVRSKVAMLEALSSAHGVYFVTGNHEYYSGAKTWIETFRRMGWKVLLNAHDVVHHNGDPLVIVGLPDPAAAGRRSSTGSAPDLTRALSGAPPDTTKILLFHQPLGYQAAEQSGIALQLSGHTHGGQYFPWSLVVHSIFAFPTNLHTHGNLQIYTSQGTGFWGPPNRFLVPPELTLLVLKKA